jgi:hypothetical protein
MKKLRFIIVIIAVLFIFGVLFFSCPLPGNGNHGTLIIALPGSNTASQAFARAAVSGAFAATLSYHIDCDGPDGRISQEAQSGALLSIPLVAGDWTVTASVFNAAGQSIGSGMAEALVESGKTTALRMLINIDAGRNDISGFAITSPVSAAGSIAPNTATIDVSVPFGTDLSAMHFAITHAGASVSPLPGTALDFSSPRIFTVFAENGQTKDYTVTVTVTDPPPPGDNTAAWPSSATWQDYGFSAMTQPGGTTVSVAAISSGTLAVYLQNADITVFNSMVFQFESLLGATGATSSDFGVSVYELAYAYSGTNFALTLAHTNGIVILSIEPNDPGSFAAWPDNSRWTIFSLSGLTQPAGTTVEDTSETAVLY